MKSLIKYTIRTLLVIVLLLIISFFTTSYLIQQPKVQTYLIHKVSEYLSKQFGNTVKVDAVDIKFFRTIEIQNAFISSKTSQNDTILFVGKLDVDLMLGRTLWEQIQHIKNKKIYIDNIALDRMQFNGFRAENDSLFNYDFFMALFSSTKTPKKPSGPIVLKINKVNITRSHLIIDDHYKDIKIDIQVSKAFMDMNDFIIKPLKIDIKEIELVDPKVLLTLYNKKEDIVKKPSNGFDVQGLGKLLNITAEQLNISNGTYGMSMRNRSINAGTFKISEMYIHDIQSDFKDYRWDSTGMHIDINQVSVNADDNFHLHKLKSKALLDNNGIYMDETEIAYNTSNLKANLSIKFSDEWRSFADFSNKVTMKADIKDAYVKSKDVAVFAPRAQKYIPDGLKIKGLVKGKLANLRVDDLYISGGRNTIIDITGNIKGLPNISQTLFDVKVSKLQTNPEDFKKLVPYIKLPAALSKSGNTSFKGTYFGFYNDFVAKGALHTENLGDLATDIRMSFPKNKAPNYSGIIKATALNLSELTGNPTLLDKADINLSIDGKGFNTNELQSKITGSIQNFYLNGFVFKEIKVDGIIDKKKFEGKAFFDDSCFLIDFNGIADFNERIPKFDFKTSIKNADLYKLNLVKDTLSVSLDGELHFQGNKIDSITGNGKFSQILIQNEKDILTLSDVDIDLKNDGEIKNYNVASDQFNAKVTGNFSVLSIVPSVKVFLSKYSKLIKPDKNDFKLERPQQLEADIKVKSDIGLFRIFAPKLRYISELQLNGKLDTKNNILSIHASIDSTNYDNIGINNIQLNGNTEGDNLLVNTQIENILYKKTNIPDVKLIINSSLDKLLSNLNIASDSSDNSVRLQTSIDFNGDSIITEILESKLKINNKTWQMKTGNELTIIDSIFIAKNFYLMEGEQKISLQNGRNTFSDARINIENINLVDIGQLIDSAHIVKDGKLNGSINLKNILKKPQANIDITINNLQILDYKAKYIGLDAVYGRAGKDILEAGGTIEDPNYQLSFDGIYDMQIKGKEKLEAEADIERLNLNFLEAILKKELLVPHAFVKGQVKISGDLKKPVLTGEAQVIDTAELKMRFLGTTFKLANEVIKLTPKGFDFGEVTLYDNYGNTAQLSGKLQHDGFKNFKADKVNVSAPLGYNFMNTTYAENQDFYGKIFAKGDVDIDGYFDNINININQLETLKNSEFNLPVTSQVSNKGYSFIKFIDPKDTTKVIEYKSRVSGINLNMNITATQDGLINIILDPNTNDKIVARGEGNLNLTLNKAGTISLNGNYNLINGKYDFNFQGVVNKTFNIRPGSSINFNGSPLKAEMNITGLYNVPSASVRNIVDSTSAIKNRTFPIDLNLLITGTLENPKIGFKISPTLGTISTQSDELNRKLDEISQNENELNNQAVALLLFNSFFPTSTTSSSGNQRFTGASNTVTQLVSTQLSSLFSKGLSKLIPGASLDLLISDLESKESRNFGFSYKQELFSNRLILTIGGNVNFGNTNTSTSIVSTTGQPANNSAIAGDFQLEYLVTQDGRIRLKTYARTANYDIINQDKIRTGGSISFQKEFDSLKDLFKPKKKK